MEKIIQSAQQIAEMGIVKLALVAVIGSLSVAGLALWIVLLALK